VVGRQGRHDALDDDSDPEDDTPDDSPTALQRQLPEHGLGLRVELEYGVLDEYVNGLSRAAVETRRRPRHYRGGARYALLTLPVIAAAGCGAALRPRAASLRSARVSTARRVRAAYGLAFYPGSTDLFASMNQRDDLGAHTPGDWLALVREGRVALTRRGEAYRGEVTTFLTGLRNPLPPILERDGSLLVGDWASGTIYLVR
jgi:hypothetical protein